MDVCNSTKLWASFRVEIVFDDGDEQDWYRPNVYAPQNLYFQCDSVIFGGGAFGR